MAKTCNRCGTMNLEWDQAYNSATGKWKLLQHKNKYGKWCGKVPDKVINKPLTKKDVELCPLCSDSNFGLCKKGQLEAHLKKYHPNGEKLTDLDYTYRFLSKHSLIYGYWQSDPHYDKYIKKVYNDKE